MAAAYVGDTDWRIISWDVDTTPEGLTTLTETWEGASLSAANSWRSGIARGDACTVTGYTTLTAVAVPRLVHEGAKAKGYVTYQSTPSGDGTASTDIDINYSSEERTVDVKVTQSSKVTVNYTAPVVTAAYVRASKPTSFRFDTEINSEDVENIRLVPVNTAVQSFVEGTDFEVVTESKWGERRYNGSAWHISEIHQKVIKEIIGD